MRSFTGFSGSPVMRGQEFDQALLQVSSSPFWLVGDTNFRAGFSWAANWLGVKFPRLECGRLRLWSILHASIHCRTSAMDRNHEAFRHFFRQRLLKAAMTALSIGLPGLEKPSSSLLR